MERIKRNVKIVCTIGPACWDYDKLFALAKAGMNVARLNFSHGDYESHLRTLKNVRAVEQELQTPIAVLLDTKGPEIRTGELPGHGKVTVKSDGEFTLFFEKKEGDEHGVYIDYPKLANEVKKGQNIFIDDGAIHLEVVKTSPEEIKCRVIVGGELGEHKGVNVPGADLSVPTLTEKDIADLKWGAENNVDYVAVSFVRSKEDIIEVRRVLEAAGASAKIIAKMETRQSVDNLDAILEVVDGMMVARGDLGVEMRTEDVPMIQKEIIERRRMQGKPVIVATQMLDSMIRNPRPTRAESSDVANAVIDGADAVMLSGGTAGGKYPFESVETMNRIIVRTEQDGALWGRKPRSPPAVCETADAVSGRDCGRKISRRVSRDDEQDNSADGAGRRALVPQTALAPRGLRDGGRREPRGARRGEGGRGRGDSASHLERHDGAHGQQIPPDLPDNRYDSVALDVAAALARMGRDAVHLPDYAPARGISEKRHLADKARVARRERRQRRHNVRNAARRARQHEHDKRHPHSERHSARPLACAPPRHGRRMQGFVPAGGLEENFRR